MSSTRHAPPGSELSQERYASSRAIVDKGLKANCVALRSGTLATEEQREVIWYLQARSHPSGLSCVVAELLGMFPERVCPRSLFNFKGKKERSLSIEQIRHIREECGSGDRFLTRGEFTADERAFFQEHEDTVNPRGVYDSEEVDRAAQTLKRRSESLPASYTAGDFLKHAQCSAAFGLEQHLTELCLDPETTFRDPWYFQDLFGALLVMVKKAMEVNRVPRNSVGEQLLGAILYARKTKSMVLFCGPRGTSKSAQARSICEQIPGLARHFMVPGGNARRDWFTGFCESYGSPCGGLKATVLQKRAENILAASHVVPVIDDALYALPTHERDANPDRLDWLVIMADRGIGSVLITNPDFYKRLVGIAARSRWSGQDFLERAFPWPAPESLSSDEIRNAAADMMPSASSQSLAVATKLTETTGMGSLHFLVKIRNCAALVAEQHGRTPEEITADDIRDALNSYVKPATQRHAAALSKARQKTKAEPMRMEPPAILASAQPSRAPRDTPAQGAREMTPAGYQVLAD